MLFAGLAQLDAHIDQPRRQAGALAVDNRGVMGQCIGRDAGTKIDD